MMHGLRKAVAGALLAGCWAAAGQDALTLRSIVRTNDVGVLGRPETISWYQGESLAYTLRVVRAGAAVAIPTNVVPIWSVTDPATNWYLRATGVVVAATSGVVAFSVPMAASALPAAAAYSSTVVLSDLTNGVPRALGVADRTWAQVIRNDDFAGTLVAPLDYIDAIAPLQAAIASAVLTLEAVGNVADQAWTNAASAHVAATGALALATWAPVSVTQQVVAGTNCLIFRDTTGGVTNSVTFRFNPSP